MARYRNAVLWIAYNDEPIEEDACVIACSVTVLLVADLFEKPPEHVAGDVLNVRNSAEFKEAC